MTVLRNYHRIKTSQPISMILVSFFSEENVYLMKSKYAIFSNIKVTKIERSAFLGHPVERFLHVVWDTTQSVLQCIITPSQWIQYQSCTHSAPSLLPGDHSGQVPLQGRTHAKSIDKQRSHPTGYPFIHLGGEQQCGYKMYCWRTKVPGIDGNQTRNPFIQNQRFNPIYLGTND